MFKLIDGRNGNHIWAERYDRKYEDLFALQDQITMAVVSFLNVKIMLLWAYLGLAAAYELNGNHEKANWAAENVMRVNPKFSLTYQEKRSFFKDGLFKKTIYDAMRRAGLK